MTRWLVLAVLVVAGAAAFAWRETPTGAVPTTLATQAPVAPAPAPVHAGSAQIPLQSDGFDSSRAWTHLRELVAIGPRPSGSAGIRQARAYIARQLGTHGLTVREQPFTADSPFGRVDMANLIVTLPGRRTDRILLTGHYDTKLMRNAVFVGANDGGSSAAFLIELARVLQTRSREFTYELVWFDGEEAFVAWRGLDHTYGSRYYVQAAKQANALSSLRAMILVDMIADRDLQIRRESSSTPWLVDRIWRAAAQLGKQDTFVDGQQSVEDDHIPFLQAGVPAVDLIDLDYPAWHTPQDTLDQVRAGSMQIVGDVLLAALPDIERFLVTQKIAPR